jgi:hypothetical protein
VVGETFPGFGRGGAMSSSSPADVWWGEEDLLLITLSCHGAATRFSAVKLPGNGMPAHRR